MIDDDARRRRFDELHTEIKCARGELREAGAQDRLYDLFRELAKLDGGRGDLIAEEGRGAVADMLDVMDHELDQAREREEIDEDEYRQLKRQVAAERSNK